jgi:hypothetical protein
MSLKTTENPFKYLLNNDHNFEIFQNIVSYSNLNDIYSKIFLVNKKIHAFVNNDVFFKLIFEAHWKYNFDKNEVKCYNQTGNELYLKYIFIKTWGYDCGKSIKKCYIINFVISENLFNIQSCLLSENNNYKELVFEDENRKIYVHDKAGDGLLVEDIITDIKSSEVEKFELQSNSRDLKKSLILELKKNENLIAQIAIEPGEDLRFQEGWNLKKSTYIKYPFLLVHTATHIILWNVVKSTEKPFIKLKINKLYSDFSGAEAVMMVGQPGTIEKIIIITKKAFYVLTPAIPKKDNY